ncbi:MAG: hypothetical protein M3146_04275 [Thermoproteota archaeon]|nr:hypothetical protein [Thermoproteota archaeon]
MPNHAIKSSSSSSILIRDNFSTDRLSKRVSVEKAELRKNKKKEKEKGDG